MLLFRYNLLLIGLLLSVPLLAQMDLSEQLLAKVEHQYNHFARERLEHWQALINNPANQQLNDQDKLELVNNFFNSNVMFIDDQSLWKKNDYWATPLEMLSVGAGDCEDYSIAKYFTLKQLGLDEDKLRITYVKAVNLGQSHMVLTYFKTKRSIPLVLDNLITEIKPANQRKDLIPVYSFNGTGLWNAKSRGEGQLVGKSSRLSLWTDLEKRMQLQQQEELQVEQQTQGLQSPKMTIESKPSSTNEPAVIVPQLKNNPPIEVSENTSEETDKNEQKPDQEMMDTQQSGASPSKPESSTQDSIDDTTQVP